MEVMLKLRRRRRSGQRCYLVVVVKELIDSKTSNSLGSTLLPAHVERSKRQSALIHCILITIHSQSGNGSNSETLTNQPCSGWPVRLKVGPTLTTVELLLAQVSTIQLLSLSKPRSWAVRAPSSCQETSKSSPTTKSQSPRK